MLDPVPQKLELKRTLLPSRQMEVMNATFALTLPEMLLLVCVDTFSG
jgi:hypothetical protein